MKPISICERTIVDGKCIETEIVPADKSCPDTPGFHKREIFGMCGCIKSEFQPPTPYCSMDPTGFWESKSQTCVARQPLKFTCPNTYKIKGNICEKIIDKPVTKTYNLTVRCLGEC